MYARNRSSSFKPKIRVWTFTIQLRMTVSIKAASKRNPKLIAVHQARNSVIVSSEFMVSISVVAGGKNLLEGSRQISLMG
jgi:hypothetical protein